MRAAGIRNILALRGDPPKGQEHFEAVEGGFSCALDLVRHIRARHGDYFGIGVAGYPEAHPDAIVDDPERMAANYAADVAYLKRKVDAGADFVVTQLFYDVERYFSFVKDCRAAGITVPILPGVMPVMAYGGFKRMTGFCKTAVPDWIAERMEALKDDEEGVKRFGIELGTDMCRRLLEGGAPGALTQWPSARGGGSGGSGGDGERRGRENGRRWHRQTHNRQHDRHNITPPTNQSNTHTHTHATRPAHVHAQPRALRRRHPRGGRPARPHARASPAAVAPRAGRRRARQRARAPRLLGQPPARLPRAHGGVGRRRAAARCAARILPPSPLPPTPPFASVLRMRLARFAFLCV